MALERLKNLRPVKRYRSERYVLISLVAFALTVVVLRGALRLTGYPQIGNDAVHIAHVLWGGLALFAGALLLLVFANRWALGVGAVLCGGGVGLFIDEVGKFITQSNDYFNPAAAPIIYALFLATVMIYLRVRRPPARDVRGEMYRALEQMTGVLDHEMSRHDLNALERRLLSLRSSDDNGAVCRLAAAMLAFIEAERPRIVEPQPGRMQRFVTQLRMWGRRIFTRPRLRAFLVFGLLAFGLWAILDMALLAFLAVAPSSGATECLRSLISPGELAALGDRIWFSIRAVLEGGIGIALIAGGTMVGLRREWRGLSVSVAGLIVALTVVDLLVFYQDQLKALIEIALQYVLLAAVFSYRRIYLEDEAEEAGRAGGDAEAAFADALRAAAAETGCSAGDVS